jgi:hypothetical protein
MDAENAGRSLRMPGCMGIEQNAGSLHPKRAMRQGDNCQPPTWQYPGNKKRRLSPAFLYP